MVSLANPETALELVTLGSLLAAANDGSVEAVHVVTVPDQTPLPAGSDARERLDAESAELLDRAREHAARFDVPVETRTVISHRSFEAVFDAAETGDADLVVMGRGNQPFWSAGRAESTVDELAGSLPCDFLVFEDRGFDPSHLLVPTAGGSDSDLSAAVARVLRDQRDATVELLHVVADDEERAAGREFLGDWAEEHGLDDAALTVDTGVDVEAAIERHARDATMLVMGATERGLLSRLFRGSLVDDVVTDVDCSVLLCERPAERSLWSRLFGSGTDAVDGGTDAVDGGTDAVGGGSRTVGGDTGVASGDGSRKSEGQDAEPDDTE